MKRAAYTLIELMITVAIISLMFILFKYNSSYIEEIRFENACGKIMTDIGYLQSMTINDGGAGLPYIEFNNGGYTCYDGNNMVLKDPFTRKDMDYQFFSSGNERNFKGEKNFKNVKVLSVLIYYSNGNNVVNIPFQKLKFNKYGGLSIFKDSSDTDPEYDNEDKNKNWDYLEINLENTALDTTKTIRVEPLTLNMSIE